MASADSEHAPAKPEQAAGPVPTDERPPASRASLLRIARWPVLIIVIAALLGLVVGYGVVLRGRSLGTSATGDSVARPTFIIGASASPLPGRSPSAVVDRSVPSADHVVQPGDTLRSIALDAYGDANEWPRIYDANRDVIGSDPDTLQAGMHLRIP